MISKLQAANLYAEEVLSEPNKTMSLFMNLFPFILIFVIFYFLLIRPQKKKQLAHKTMLDSLKVGDKVLLSSGMAARVSKISDSYVTAEIASGVEVEVLRSSIASVITDK